MSVWACVQSFLCRLLLLTSSPFRSRSPSSLPFALLVALLSNISLFSLLLCLYYLLFWVRRSYMWSMLLLILAHLDQYNNESKGMYINLSPAFVTSFFLYPPTFSLCHCSCAFSIPSAVWGQKQDNNWLVENTKEGRKRRYLTLHANNYDTTIKTNCQLQVKASTPVDSFWNIKSLRGL